MITDWRGWLFIDHFDMNARGGTVDAWLAEFPGSMTKASRLPLCGMDWADVTHLSVCNTGVGKTLLDRCPKLQWVVVRRHNYAQVALDECRRRGVGVLSVGAVRENVADYIVHHLGPPPVLLWGWGRIGYLVGGRIKETRGEVWFIDKTMPESRIKQRLGIAGTVVLCLPTGHGLSKPPLSREFLDYMVCDKLVSISPASLVVCEDLLAALDMRRVRAAAMDELPKQGREDLLDTGKVQWTEHTAWLTNFRADKYRTDTKRLILEGLCERKPGGALVVVSPDTPQRPGFRV